MNHLVRVTLFTGQTMVLEALQRWLRRPCDEAPEAARRARRSVRGLLVLLLKTAATGVLATVLDAAIEYRRRQLLAAAEDGGPGRPISGPGEGGAGAGGAPAAGWGPLSRAGAAAWRARLLLAVDEMERQAGLYGIEPTARFAPKPDAALEAKLAALAGAGAEGKGGGGAGAEGTEGAEGAARQALLASTVEQLAELAKSAGASGGGGARGEGAAAARALDERVDALLDSLLGPCPAAPPPRGALAASPSCAALSAAAGGADNDVVSAAEPPVCAICMDRRVRVQMAGCRHELCFACARRLCEGADHAPPRCPWDRSTIGGFLARPTAPAGAAAAGAAAVGTAAAAPPLPCCA
jgi:hypothetical protein